MEDFNIRKVRNITKGLLETLELSREHTIEVLRIYQRREDEKSFNMSKELHNRQCSNVANILSTLYITCCDKSDKYTDELTEKQKLAYDLQLPIIFIDDEPL
jgi:hypothetical protein